MELVIIVAMDPMNGIGKDNNLLWHIPEDMKFFRETTMGHVVVMGRKNYESIPEKFRPLKGRENVILTRNMNFTAENCKVFHSVEDFFSAYEDSPQKIFVIGGGEIYKEIIEKKSVKEMYITHVYKFYQADTFFPSFDMSEWETEDLVTREDFSIRHYTLTYTRCK